MSSRVEEAAVRGGAVCAQELTFVELLRARRLREGFTNQSQIDTSRLSFSPRTIWIALRGLPASRLLALRAASFATLAVVAATALAALLRAARLLLRGAARAVRPTGTAVATRAAILADLATTRLCVNERARIDE